MLHEHLMNMFHEFLAQLSGKDYEKVQKITEKRFYEKLES